MSGPSTSLLPKLPPHGGLVWSALIFLAFSSGGRLIAADQPIASEGMLEWTFTSGKAYSDPFNDVEIDVVFRREGSPQSWRVPAFWRGGDSWTVRFRPPTPGEYRYRVQSTDAANAQLNDREGRIALAAYQGDNALLKRGPFRVSANKRYFEHADGTPFYWLGDTWWTGLSDRLSWDGFRRLTSDRKAKGFTVVQFVAGLVPGYEELSPVDPGFQNEGGAVWDPQFKRINPAYFDYADGRVRHLVDAGIAPAIVGAWSDSLPRMGVARLQKHWRYVIARYGAYPVFWIVGGEVFDPPESVASKGGFGLDAKSRGGWTEIARYLRATDPYHHPMSVHEVSPDDLPLQDETLTDFKFFQPAHFGWGSIGVEVAQLGAHYSRRSITKPLVVGEIGYETLGKTHLEDFQRVAFWLAMLNGAAGHSYGANGTWESYTADRQIHRKKWSFLTWEEGMRLPGSYQVGLGAKLLRRYPWWRFTPRPDWIAPRGTTFLETREDALDHFHMDLVAEWMSPQAGDRPSTGEWTARQGDFRLPYAAGIPGEVRFIYMPYFQLISPAPPTIFSLEKGVRYHARYWEPSSGIEVDLGAIERPAPGVVFRQDRFDRTAKSHWTDVKGKSESTSGALALKGEALAILDQVHESNLVASVGLDCEAEAALIVRYRGPSQYLAAIYSPAEAALYLLEHEQGVDGQPLGRVPVSLLGDDLRLTVETRDEMAIAAITDGQQTFTTPIVEVRNSGAGSVGLLHRQPTGTQHFAGLELRRSPRLVQDDRLERKIYDAAGAFRGELRGGAAATSAAAGTTGWDAYGTRKHLLLDAYRPEVVPTAGDWVLVLDSR